MYRVINFFTDLQDAEHPYNVGDKFPRDGMDVTLDRLTELSGSDNKQGRPLIEFIPDEPVHTEKEEEINQPEEPAEQPVEKPKRSRKKEN